MKMEGSREKEFNLNMNSAFRFYKIVSYSAFKGWQASSNQ